MTETCFGVPCIFYFLLCHVEWLVQSDVMSFKITELPAILTDDDVCSLTA